MNLRNCYLSMIRAYQGGWDAMAAALGYSRDALENRIYERRGQRLHVEDALQMQAFCGQPLLAEAIATISGGTFVRLPCVASVGNDEISDKFHDLFEELGQLSKEFREATKDGEIDEGERELINDLVDRMHKTMDELRALTFKVYCKETANKKRGAK